MFGIKTTFKRNLKRWLLQPTRKSALVEQPISPLLLKWGVAGLKLDLDEQRRTRGLDNPGPSRANPYATTAWQQLVGAHANNLGNWLVDSPYNSITELEKAVIRQLLTLYGASAKTHVGYMGSGSTEGNLLAAWLGRKTLQRIQTTNKRKIVLIQTDLTHYSIRKCADIINVPVVTTALSEHSWAMTSEGLKKTVASVYKEGFRGILLPLTAGYTMTGTSDPLAEICATIRELKKQYRDLEFFVWVDAALSGLVLPFSQKSFRPLQFPEISLLTVDFHKFAGVPYPASVVLYKKALGQKITNTIPYLDQRDTTLLGSRPGAAAAAIWATLQGYGRTGFTDLVKECQQQREQFLKYITKLVPTLTVVSDPASVQALLIVNKDQIPTEVCQKFGLVLRKHTLQFTKKTHTIRYYKVFFLPTF